MRWLRGWAGVHRGRGPRGCRSSGRLRPPFSPGWRPHGGWSRGTAPRRRSWRRWGPTSSSPAGRRRWGSSGSPSATRVCGRWRTCWTGAPGSGWCLPIASVPSRWPSGCWPRASSSHHVGGWFHAPGCRAQTAAMATYTHGHGDEVLRAYRRRTAENSAGYLLRVLRPGLDLLDVGCRPGSITVDLAARVAPGRVLGVDVASAPLEQARELAARAGVQAEFRVGDVYALEADDGSFDVVHAHQVLQHLTDPVAALREMARVCRAGGVIAVRDVDYGNISWFPEERALHRWLALYDQVMRRNGGEPRAGRRLLSWAHAAGLHDVEPSAGVVLRHPGGPPVVGAVVGRPAHGVDVHRAGARARVRDPGRARGDRRCLAALGGGG